MGVKRATKEDFEDIRNLYKANWDSISDDKIKDLEPSKEFSIENYFVILDKDVFVGTFSFHFLTSTTAEVHLLIEKDKRKSIAPDTLGKEVRTACKSIGMEVFVSFIPESKKDTLWFLHSIGFKNCGEIKNGIILKGKKECLKILTMEV